jgi:hypothetical protein
MQGGTQPNNEVVPSNVSASAQSELQPANNTIQATQLDESRLQRIERCMLEHTGEKKCNVALNIDGDLNVKTKDLSGLLLNNMPAPFPSNFETTIHVQLQGGIECSKLVDCLQNQLN